MDRYKDSPLHPLHSVPNEILEAAREQLRGAVEWGDVDEEMREPLADAVVISLLPWLLWED